MTHIGRKRPVNLSLSEDLVSRAREHGVNLSEVAEAALRQEIERRDREATLASMDRTMRYWNEFEKQGVSFAEEYGTL